MSHLNGVPRHHSSRGCERQRTRENPAKLRAHGEPIVRLPPARNRYSRTTGHARKVAVDDVLQGFPSFGSMFIEGTGVVGGRGGGVQIGVNVEERKETR